MIYLLTITLFLMTLFFALLDEFDVLSPNVIVSGTFCLCCFFSSLYTVQWNLPMHLNTYCLIVFEIIIFALGVFLIRLALGRKWNNNISKLNFVESVKLYNVSNAWLLGALIVGVLFVYLNYRDTIFIANQLTDSKQLGIMLKAVLEASYYQNDIAKFSRWHSYRYILLEAFSYVTLYAFIYDSTFGRWKFTYLKLLLPTLIYSAAIFLTGGRQPYIYLIIFIIVVALYLYQSKYNFAPKKLVKLIIPGVFLILAFLLVFFGIGILNGKISGDFSPAKVLAHYIGININALDYFVNTIYPSSVDPGSMTLANVYEKLRFVFPTMTRLNTYNTNFVHFDGITTNVYTALMRYIRDYGYIGCTILMFLFGIISGFCYSSIKFYKKEGIAVIVYAALCFPIFLFCREERIFMNLISTTSVYLVICITIFYKLLLKRN